MIGRVPLAFLNAGRGLARTRRAVRQSQYDKIDTARSMKHALRAVLKLGKE